MRQQGRLTDWKDDRGFGFITPISGGPAVFVHISEFPRVQRRPIQTDLVTFTVRSDDKGRLRAEEVLYLAPTRMRDARPDIKPPLPQVAPALAVSSSFIALLIATAALGTTPWLVPGEYVAMSLVAFFVYGLDKSAAENGRWRTAESTLHFLAVAGGWPGAFLAQRIFRHKTKKQPFQTLFWLTVAANVGVLAWLLSSISAVSG